MAFPASTQALSEGLNAATREAGRIKAFSSRAASVMRGGPVSGNQVLQIMSEMSAALALWDRVAALPGIQQYARDQYSDQALDIGVEFTNMRNAAIAVRDWVVANFPVSAGGYIEKDTLGMDGSISVRQFPPTQTAPLSTLLDTLVAAIA